ncbi:zinc finger MYM-type protein 1-like [Mixophyes fleayi]|uniref:zinc finger MYM-type protein 1-like n=1 Tax=Mixophyes fleayi TaxID=3061075 RepID=UPI003F4E08AC
MYKHASGSAKRKKKREREKEALKQQKLMHRFITPKIPTVSSEDPEPEFDTPGTSQCSMTAHMDTGKQQDALPASSKEASNTTSMKSGPSRDIGAANVQQTSSAFCEEIADLQIESIQKLSTVLSRSQDTSRKSMEDDIVSYSHDPAEWVLDNNTIESIREYFSRKTLKNTLSDFSASRRIYSDCTRLLTPDLFWRKKINGESVHRDWLIYSESKGTVFCIPCKLYSSVSHDLVTSGFNDWKNAESRFKDHETSSDHCSCVTKFTQLAKYSCRIDKTLALQMNKEQNYSREVLKRVVSVIKFLGGRGLPFHGINELLGSPQNGWFLGCLELIAQFDPFLQNHIKQYGGAGSGVSNYMSSTTVEEFIELMGTRVLDTIVHELKRAKYYSVIVDSTPDLSHVEQLAIVVRYVNKDKPVERFLGFVPMHSHTGEHFESTLLSVLSDKNIDICNCRGQSYDNASNMSAKYSGLQARICAINPLALYVPCSAHSLNLVGACAADSCLTAVSFFHFLECLYTFFSSSTHQWEILTKHLCKASGHLSIKRLSSTRWSARADATNALRRGYRHVGDALNELKNSELQPANARGEASDLEEQLNRFETAILLVVWGNILERLDATTKTLQKTNDCIDEVVKLYSSLEDYVQEIRDLFDTFEAEAKQMTSNHFYRSEGKHSKKWKRFHDEEENSNEPHITAREKFISNTINVIIDRLTVELNKRHKAYEIINRRFSILKSSGLPINELRSLADNLQNNYPDDIDDSFTEEFIQFSSMLPEESNPLAMRQYIIDHDLMDTFPNTETMLRIFLCMPIANASGESSFSCLKRIKNESRTTMGQDRPLALSLLSVESDLVKQLDFNDLVNDFVKKRRRIAL